MKKRKILELLIVILISVVISRVLYMNSTPIEFSSDEKEEMAELALKAYLISEDTSESEVSIDTENYSIYSDGLGTVTVSSKELLKGDIIYKFGGRNYWKSTVVMKDAQRVEIANAIGYSAIIAALLLVLIAIGELIAKLIAKPEPEFT